MTDEHVDVLIVGAGLSGICAAYYLQKLTPQKSYLILEGREASGGTWDLFRYPGVRSDSDIFTLGYSFRPWQGANAITSGPEILDYIRATAQEFGIDRHIRLNHRLRCAAWSSAEARWTVDVECGPEHRPLRLTCSFLFLCSGYYDYDQGYTPEWPGMEQFAGRIVHPQHWPADLETAGKRVVIIGSGATAVTLAPALAKTAAQVTILQRSPTYIVSAPAQDTLAIRLRRFLPPRPVHAITRWKYILTNMFYYSLMRWKPAMMKRNLIDLVRKELGPSYDVATHFTPRYNPWDQRLCLVPDGDLFKAIQSGRVSMATGQIDAFTPSGIRLGSGQDLPADIIVTATGLVMKLMNGVELLVDGRRVELPKTLSYKGMMLSDVPNMAFVVGYTNASWTLKGELVARYVCRLLNFMERRGYAQCTPRKTDAAIQEMPVIDFSSGYVQRALPYLPSQGSKRPWKLYQNYILDLLTFRLGRMDDDMEFSRQENTL
jgi:monooxygenase